MFSPESDQYPMEWLDRRNDDLVPVGKMPDDHILDLPILFHGIPHFAQVFPVFVRDDTEVWLVMFGNVRHPEIDEVIGQAFSLEVDAVAFGANLAYDQLRQLVEVEISG